MASDFGRHHADDNAIDRARIQYLAGEPSSVDPTSADRPGTDTDSAPVQLSDTDRAELDELRALLADPTLWSEPPAELEDSVVAAIAAEASARPPVGPGINTPFDSAVNSVIDSPLDRPTETVRRPDNIVGFRPPAPPPGFAPPAPA